MTKTTSFQTDICPLFTERDIQGMKKGFKLESYDDVKKHAAAIYDRIRGIGGAVMPSRPPIGGGPWPQSRLNCSLNGWRTGFYLSRLSTGWALFIHKGLFIAPNLATKICFDFCSARMSCPIGRCSPPENVLQVQSCTAFDKEPDYFIVPSPGSLV